MCVPVVVQGAVLTGWSLSVNLLSSWQTKLVPKLIIAERREKEGNRFMQKVVFAVCCYLMS